MEETMASGIMQTAHQQADNRPNPLGRFKEMMSTYHIDMRGQINKIETCAGDLAKSDDRAALDTLPMLHKIVASLRSYQSNLLRSWERYEQSTTPP
jgi:hypothetical protein